MTLSALSIDINYILLISHTSKMSKFVKKGAPSASSNKKFFFLLSKTKNKLVSH